MADQQINHDELMDEIRKINKKLDPIYETYQAWQTIGRWGKTFLWIAGAILGLFVAWKDVFSKR